MARLTEAVRDAAEFMDRVDEQVSDGDQTARQVLAHLVFWHREYVKIVRALADNRQPRYRIGTFHDMNKLAYAEFRHVSMTTLARYLIKLQNELSLARAHINPAIRFPLKAGAAAHRLDEWIPQIDSHIQSHTLRLKRAEARASKMKKRQK